MKLNILKKADEHEFRPLLAEIEEEPVSPLGRIILWLVTAALITGVVMLFAAKIDVVVSAPGIIIPEGEIKVLQPLEGGVISKINVKAGDFVKAGDVIMEIDHSAVEPDYEAKRENLARAALEKKCLESLTEGIPGGCEGKELSGYVQAVLNAEYRTEAKKEELKQTEELIKSLSAQASAYGEMLRSERELYSKLETVKDIVGFDRLKASADAILNLTKEISGLEYDMASAGYRSSQLEKEMKAIKGEIQEELRKELSRVAKTYATLKAEVDEIAFRHEKQRILSPVDGYVNVLFVNTAGGVVTPAQQLVSIVPADARLIAKAQVLNKDAGFIEAGQECVIKMETFDFQKYGKIPCTVTNVSADSVDNEKLGRVYEVYARPEKTVLTVNGKEARITSGMNLTAEVRVGKRRAAEFFIYPLVRYLDEGLSVR